MKVDRGSPDALATRVAKHAALADPARLMAVDHLLLGDASPSELQGLLGLPSNLLAHHLNVLEDAGIVLRRRSQGDRRRTYLTLAPDGLAGLGVGVGVGAASGPVPTAWSGHRATAATRVVFVCTANSARSQLATALWRSTSDLPVASAGTHPAAGIARGARAAARRHGLWLADDAPRHLDDVLRDDDLVVTVCDNAHEELDGRDAIHWAIPDPVVLDTRAAYDETVVDLRRRVTTLSAITQPASA